MIAVCGYSSILKALCIARS